MNNRERNWYEGEHERHTASCNCLSCSEAKRLKEQSDEKLAEEQARMRVGAAERVRALKERGHQRNLPRIDWSWLK